MTKKTARALSEKCDPPEAGTPSRRRAADS